MSDQLRFDNRVVVVTGAGAGIGREYALEFAARGAKVVVNDLGGSVKGDGGSHNAADKVVAEIKAKGGIAVPNYDSVEFGDKVIKTALDAFGRVDVVINNAGVLRDVSFQKMTEQDWNFVIKVHLTGTFSVTRAAWNHMRDKNYGRIINTSSSSGLFGNFGQSNYAAAKLGLHGLTMSLAKEGEKKNIFVNTIAPYAATRMTEGVLNDDILQAMSPTAIVPLVVFLAHESCVETGSLYECGGGFISKYRWNRTMGAMMDLPFTAEDVRDQWEKINDFSKSEFPVSNGDTLPKILENAERCKNKKAQAPQHKPAAQPKQTAPSTNTSSAPAGGEMKTDKTFNLMNAFLEAGEGKDVVAKLQSVFGFEITPKKGEPPVRVWTIDLKNGAGHVKQGKPATADATFTMTDDDFEQVVLGKLNPQTAFVQGKMKIKGNMKKASAFTPELFPKPTPENVAKYMSKQGGATTTSTPVPSTNTGSAPAGGEMKTDKTFNLMNAFLEAGEGKDVVAKLQSVFGFEITPKKGEPPVRVWTIDLKNGAGHVKQGKPATADATFTMTDDDFEQVVLGKLNPQTAFVQGKMKIKGNMKKASAFTPELFPKPTPENVAKYMTPKPKL